MTEGKQPSEKDVSFELDALCNNDGRMSFDYAYGYLVASSCVGFFQHAFSGPHLTTVKVSGFQPHMSSRLNDITEGFIKANSRTATEAGLFRAEIANIDSYFAAKTASNEAPKTASAPTPPAPTAA